MKDIINRGRSSGKLARNQRNRITNFRVVRREYNICGKMQNIRTAI